jgi:hypothetical protein
MKTLAKRIERELTAQTEGIGHCAIYEDQPAEAISRPASPHHGFLFAG